MTVVLILAVGLLAGAGVYLLLARRVFPVILGLSLLTHAANLVMLAAGDASERAPIVVEGIERQLLADPVPQALILTAIVISMAVTIYLLALFTAGARVLKTDGILQAADSDSSRNEETLRAELAGHGRIES
jgi:multisubunit Na+/H+ antiporter MnhC subunit